MCCCLLGVIGWSGCCLYRRYKFADKILRTVVESGHQAQSTRDYLPSLDISINQAKQQSTALHIGTHILSETRESNTQTHYQLVLCAWWSDSTTVRARLPW
jgi:hypothetical protein